MDTPTTALSRVEAVLQASESGLFIHQIAREADVTEKEAKAAVKELAARVPVASQARDHTHGCGRELFANFRSVVGDAEAGASALFNR